MRGIVRLLLAGAPDAPKGDGQQNDGADTGDGVQRGLTMHSLLE